MFVFWTEKDESLQFECPHSRQGSYAQLSEGTLTIPKLTQGGRKTKGLTWQQALDVYVQKSAPRFKISADSIKGRSF